MEEQVRAEYERITSAVVLRSGSVVDTSRSGWFGWADYRVTQHLRVCGVKSHGALEEDATWHEFRGTFFDGDTSEHGLEVRDVCCRCEAIVGRTVRWQASVSDVAREVFAELYRATHSEVTE